MRGRVIFYVLTVGIATVLVTGVAAAGSIGAVASKQPSDTLSERLSDTANRLADSSGKVTYKVQKANWFVLSGQTGQAIFYAKTLFSHDQFKSFELTYDRSAAALYNPLVSRVASCFTDLA